MTENLDSYLSTAVIVGRHHPLTQPLSKALFDVRQKVFVADVPALHAGASKEIPPPKPDMRAWLLWCNVSELEDKPTDGDLKDRARRITGSVQMMGASEAVVVTDFALGEIESFRDEGIAYWRKWDDREMQSFLDKAGWIRSRLVAYFQLVRQLSERKIPLRIVHCGTITGDSQTGEFVHSPAIEALFKSLWDGSLNFIPSDDEGWMPGISSDFAAAFLARMPEHVADRSSSYWLYDRRGLPLAEVIANAAQDLGRPVPSKRVPLPAIKLMEWSGALRRMGLEAASKRMVRKRFDAQPEVDLAAAMGLEWPDRRQSMRNAADWFLRRQGVDPMTVKRPPLPSRPSHPEKRSKTLVTPPRDF